MSRRLVVALLLLLRLLMSFNSVLLLVLKDKQCACEGNADACCCDQSDSSYIWLEESSL